MADEPCKKCGQIDNGQSGEYPCAECGLPMTHDEPLKTSEEWSKNCQFKVLDPDGWDRRNFQFSWFEEKISEAEFNRRVNLSTVQRNKDEPLRMMKRVVVFRLGQMTKNHILIPTSAIISLKSDGVITDNFDENRSIGRFTNCHCEGDEIVCDVELDRDNRCRRKHYPTNLTVAPMFLSKSIEEDADGAIMKDAEMIGLAVVHAHGDESLNGNCSVWKEVFRPARSEPLRTKMSKQELVKALKAIVERKSGDPETDHIEADELLLEYIDNEEVKEAFGAIEMWYA